MSLFNTPYNNPAKPIIVFQLVSNCYPQDIRQMFAKTLEFIETMNAQHVYRVVDTTHLTGTKTEILRLIETSFERVPGSCITDTRITPIGSGPSSIADLYHEVLRTNPNCRRHSVPFFPTLHTALEFVRQL
jgi:hypothetical protein